MRKCAFTDEYFTCTYYMYGLYSFEDEKHPALSTEKYKRQEKIAEE